MDKETRYIKDRKTYGYIASLPIIVAIVHLFFTLFMMMIVSYHEDTNTFGNLYTLGEMYSSSIFASILVGLKPSLSLIKSMPGLIGILFGLVMIFLSTFSVKGKKFYYYIAFYIYVFDSIMMIPSIILSYCLNTIVKLQVYDIILMILLHAVFLFLFIYGTKVIKRINKYEEEKALEESQIHITKGE